MGLFDKLKMAVGGTKKVESAEPKEDLSGVSLMDLIEKVDAYNTEFCNNLNNSNYTKLETAMIELANRAPTVPLTKRGAFTAFNMYYKQYLDAYKQCMAVGPKGKEIAQQQSMGISSMLGSMATILNY